MKIFKAVLFDFDGVIGRTMEDNYKACKYALSTYKIPINKNNYFLLEGMSTFKTARYFLKINSQIKNINNLAKEIVKYKEKHFSKNNTSSLYNGAKSVVKYLKEKDYCIGMVSGGSYNRISKMLNGSFIKNFDVIITADRVKKCKPHPYPYLIAAKRLSLKPSDCISIENAPLGIESAKRAGMYCIAVCSTLEREYLRKADKIINKISDLKKIL